MDFEFIVIFPQVSYPLFMSRASLLTLEITHNHDACYMGYSSSQSIEVDGPLNYIVLCD